jgi:hypothetical protein
MRTAVTWPCWACPWRYRSSHLKIDLERPGTLEVVGSPAGARVQITGPGGFSTEQGLPVKVTGAAKGSYRLEVTLERYKTA